MGWIGQLVTIAAVLAGAAGTYVVGRLSDRDRFARELKLRWDQRRLDAYLAYVTAVKMVGATANVILDLRLKGGQAEQIETRIAQLSEFDNRRDEAFEALPLIADSSTIEAAHELNEAVWKLEQAARLGQVGQEAEWLLLADQWVVALNNFHAAARQSLSVVGTFTRRDVAALAVAETRRATK